MYNLVMTDFGIGDVICSLYAVQALAENKPNDTINLYLRQHLDWAKLAGIPNLVVHKYTTASQIENPIYLYDEASDNGKIVKHTNSPKLLFTSKLGLEPRVPKLREDLCAKSPVIQGRYIVLSPFASRVNRTWEIQNWIILAKTLQALGYKVIAIDGPNQKNRVSKIGVDHFWGQNAEWTFNVCNNAELIITNDSGMAHIGGWLNRRTLVLMTQLKPEHFYDFTNNKFIVPEQHCTGCQFIKDNGYELRCDYGCWVLQSISPKTVLKTAVSYLSEIN